MIARLLDLLSKARLFPRRLAVDLRSDAICWAESRWTLRGYELVASGREEVEAGERPHALLGQLAETRRFRGADIIIAVRHPELRLQRLELPGMPKAEARSIGARRAATLAEEMPEPANSVFAMALRRAGRALWLVACPEAFAEFTLGQWRSLGLEVGRLQSVHLSLGAMTRKLPAPKAGELRTFFEVGEGQATCVVADSEGWIFSRDIAFKASSAAVMDDDLAVHVVDPYERLATELRRTLHYVESELRLGIVSEMYVSGDLPDPEGLIASIVAQAPVDAKLLTDALEGSTIEGLHPSQGVALGLAQAASLEGGNLLGDIALSSRTRENVYARLVVACAAFGCIVLLSGGWLSVSLNALHADATRFDQLWAEMDDTRRATYEAREARRRADQLSEIAERVDAPAPPFGSAIQSIGMLLPGDAVLQKFKTVREGERWRAALEVEFRGASMAEAADDAGQFRVALAASPIWRVRNVSQRRDMPQRIGGQSTVRVRFDLDAELRPTEPVAAGARAPVRERSSHG